MTAMKRCVVAVATWGMTTLSAWAADPFVNYAVQALSGLVGDTPRFVPVYCHDVGLQGASEFELICAPNVPPTNSKRTLEDHNILSKAGMRIRADYSESKPKKKVRLIAIELDLRKVEADREGFERLVQIALECVRLTAAMRDSELEISVLAKDGESRKSAEGIVLAFEQHDPKKPFSRHVGREP